MLREVKRRKKTLGKDRGWKTLSNDLPELENEMKELKKLSDVELIALQSLLETIGLGIYQDVWHSSTWDGVTVWGLTHLVDLEMKQREKESDESTW